MIKTILISQVPLPYSHIGSWTTLYHNYLSSQSGIDVILCPQSDMLFPDITYSFVKESFSQKVQRKFLKLKKLEYISALEKLIKENDQYVIQIVDNYGIVEPVHKFLIKKGIRKNCYLQFFYHGFAPYQQIDSSEKFYNLLDEIIVLTQSSYEVFKEKIAVLPTFFSILKNGIDTSKLRSISEELKRNIKENLGFEDKKVFLWCSQDRPKKGLNIILEAWSKTYSVEKNMLLVIIGCEAKQNSAGIKYLGRIPNDELPKFYQVADCYLFPTLWHEGFGMSLIEALHCGCYCIASKLGGVPEVLQYGKFGKLIENPHFVEEWVLAIEEFLISDFRYPSLPDQLYSTDTWNLEMNQIIETAKHRLTHRV